MAIAPIAALRGNECGPRSAVAPAAAVGVARCLLAEGAAELEIAPGIAPKPGIVGNGAAGGSGVSISGVSTLVTDSSLRDERADTDDEGGGGIVGTCGAFAGRDAGNEGGGVDPPRRLVRAASAICPIRSINTCPSAVAYGSSAWANA